MDLSVVISTWNRSRMLAGVLESLDKSEVPSGIEWEAVIVDNNSTDDTREVCKAFVDRNPRRFRYFFEPSQGKSYALNSALEQVSAEVVALTDDDVTVHPHWVAEILRIVRESDCAGVGGRIVPVWNCKQPSWLEFDGPYSHPSFFAIIRFEHGDKPFELKGSPIGANMAFRRSVMNRYSGFRTDLSGNHGREGGALLGGEDTEYCRRLMNAGEKLIYAPNAIVYHPVDSHRVTKAYLRRFAFSSGRFIRRMGGIPEGMKCYFGVPRFLLGLALQNLAKWITSFNPKRRVYYMLEFSQVLGHIAEARKWTRPSQPGTEVSGAGSAG